MKKQRVLFVDSDNSGCSQMLEGLLRVLYQERFEAYSAGVKPGRVNSGVIKAMGEIGIDLFTHRSKSIDEFRDMTLDYVVSIDSVSQNIYKFLPNCKAYLQVSFDDCQLESPEKNHEQVLARVRKTRDEARNWIIATFGESMKNPSSP
ncbi:MAG: arsenate reductase ArsC [Negativicutes bacterium]|nr:arsenate reductase ArsC [Negativicutes bacterium]